MKTYLFFLFFFISGFSHAADTSFEKAGLDLIARHFNKKSIASKNSNPHMQDLTLSLELFYDLYIKPSNHNLALSIHNIDDLKLELEQENLLSIKKYLLKIAAYNLKIILNSNDEEEMRIVKTITTNRYVPVEMRYNLLGCFTELKRPELNLWLLNNPDFENMLNSNVDQFLKLTKHQDAEKYIESNIKSGSDIYKKLHQKLINYLMEKNRFVHAEEIIEHHFKKGENAYEELALSIFNYYLQKNQIMSALCVLEKYFIKPSTFHDSGACALFDHYFDNRILIEAEKVLEKYLVKGSLPYEKCATKIFNLYSLPAKLKEAQVWLQKHFITGQPATDKLAIILAQYLIRQENTKLVDVKLFIIKNMSRMDLASIENLLSELKNPKDETSLK